MTSRHSRWPQIRVNGVKRDSYARHAAPSNNEAVAADSRTWHLTCWRWGGRGYNRHQHGTGSSSHDYVLRQDGTSAYDSQRVIPRRKEPKNDLTKNC